MILRNNENTYVRYAGYLTIVRVGARVSQNGVTRLGVGECIGHCVILPMLVMRRPIVCCFAASLAPTERSTSVSPRARTWPGSCFLGPRIVQSRNATP